MSKKKIILAAVAAALACTATFTGSLAYLTAKTGNDKSVVNTFTAASGLLDPSDATFKIEENKVELSQDGSEYVLIPTEISDGGNTYDQVIAGMTIAKNPKLTINLKTNTSAYVFVEVKNTLSPGAFTFELSDTLTPVKKEGVALTGSNGGTIYLVGNGATAGATGAEINGLELIDGSTIEVGSSIGDSDLGELSFYAYACQSTGFSSPAEAFTACFSN